MSRATKKPSNNHSKRKGSELTVPITRTSLRKLDRKTREQWGRHLHQLMKARGLSQSDLAHKTFGGTEDNGGTMGRDRISKYLSGKSFPENRTIAKLCNALNCELTDLLPAAVLNALENIERTPIVVKFFPNDMCECKFSGVFRSEFAKELIDLMRKYNPDIPHEKFPND